jgi:hypothetical protein
MQPPVFLKLCGEVAQAPVKQVSRLPVEEQVAIFLYVVGQAASNHATQDCFQHSGETISRCVLSLIITTEE